MWHLCDTDVTNIVKNVFIKNWTKAHYLAVHRRYGSKPINKLQIVYTHFVQNKPQFI